MSFRAYDIVALLSVYETLRTLRPSDRRRVEALLQQLAHQPSLPGDFEAHAEDRRLYQVKVVGDWMPSCWSDHAVREVRITDLDRIE